MYYEAPVHLESCLWYCFQKAFQHAGAKVLDQGYGGYGYHPYWWGAPPPQARQPLPKDTTEFHLTLHSMTDQESRFQVQVFKNGEVKLQKEYSAMLPAAATQDKVELEKRAYRRVDQMVQTVFKDREFQNVF